MALWFLNDATNLKSKQCIESAHDRSIYLLPKFNLGRSLSPQLLRTLVYKVAPKNGPGSWVESLITQLRVVSLWTVAARSLGQQRHVPQLETAVPRLAKWANINRVSSKIKRRGIVKLQCRRTSSQYRCDDTVLSTVTMIVWTHQLYSCHNTVAGCWVI